MDQKLKKQIIWFCVLIFSFYSSLLFADEKENSRTAKRPKIGLVLSGGGARGASHIGVLKVLEELRIPIDMITGTSMGSVVGGLYAYGYSPQEIEALLAKIDWDNMVSDKPPRTALSVRRKSDEQNIPVKFDAGWKNSSIVIPAGLIHGQKLNTYLHSVTLSAPGDFDKLPIRYRAVAADVETGETVIMKDGNLATAMRASLSIPGVFVPVERDGRLLMDGGFVNNIPVKLAQDMGADILIVVDLSGELPKRSDLTTPLSILNQTLGMQIQRNTAEQLAALNSKTDVVIKVDLGHSSSTDFKLALDFITKGEIATKQKALDLSRYSLSQADYLTYKASIRNIERHAPFINKVTINNKSGLDDSIIESYIHVEPGKPLDINRLESDLDKLHGLGIFSSTEYEIIEVDNETRLMIHVTEKSWGPQYLKFGMNLDINFERTARVNLTASHHFVPLNSSGSELRTEVQFGYNDEFYIEYYQPLDRQLEYFISPWLKYTENTVEPIDSTEQAIDHVVSSTQVGIRTGHLFDTWGSLSFGLNSKSGDKQANVSGLSIANPDSSAGSWDVEFTYDQLDSMDFPANGVFTKLNFIANRVDLGASVNEERLQMNFLWANTFDRNTILFWSSIGGLLNSEPDTESRVTIGGLFSLSGFRQAELSGRYAAVSRLMYMREISDSQSLLKLPLYFGASFEAGNTWHRSADIRFDSLLLAGSLFIGIETPIGPLYLATGYAEGGHSQSYLFLGRNFSFF